MFVIILTLVLAPLPSLLTETYAYTWSLLLFVVPSVLALVDLRRQRPDAFAQAKLPVAVTLLLLAPMGFVLNLLFADSFFRYDNPNAVVGLYLRGIDLQGGPSSLIPVEEFLFYTFGFVAMTLVYVWGDAVFFRASSPEAVARPTPTHTSVRSSPPRLVASYGRDVPARPGDVVPAGVRPVSFVSTSWRVILGASALVALATGLKWVIHPTGGFPGYLAFLVLVPTVVTVLLYPVARSRVNWQSYAFTMMAIVAVSVTWEVSLALPNGWWGYRPELMLGLFVKPWHGLPIEAVLVWFLGSFATVVTYEAARVFCYHPAVRWRPSLVSSDTAPPTGSAAA